MPARGSIHDASSGCDDDSGDERRRPEGQERRRDERSQGCERDRQDASCVPPCRRDGLVVCGARLSRSGRCRFCGSLRAFRNSAARSEAFGRRAGSRSQRGIDGGDETPREPAPLRGERRCALLDRPCDLLDRHAPERMPLAQRLPEEHPDRPDVALWRRLASVETLRRDVRERSRDVADGGEGVRAVELGETEVEEADREVVAILDEDVRGLDVAVDDSGPMGMRERIEDLSRDLDSVAIGERSGTNRLAERSSGHVLVCDVDVARVVADVVRAHAAVVPQPACRDGLPLGAGGRLALPRDDLQRDVEAVPLVEREPHRARAPGSERAHGAIAPENELLGGRDGRNGGQRPTLFAMARPTPWSSGRKSEISGRESRSPSLPHIERLRSRSYPSSSILPAAA